MCSRQKMFIAKLSFVFGVSGMEEQRTTRKKKNQSKGLSQYHTTCVKTVLLLSPVSAVQNAF